MIKFEPLNLPPLYKAEYIIKKSSQWSKHVDTDDSKSEEIYDDVHSSNYSESTNIDHFSNKDEEKEDEWRSDSSCMTTNTVCSLSHFAVSMKDWDLVNMFRSMLTKRLSHQLFFGYEWVFGIPLDNWLDKYIGWNTF